MTTIQCRGAVLNDPKPVYFKYEIDESFPSLTSYMNSWMEAVNDTASKPEKLNIVVYHVSRGKRWNSRQVKKMIRTGVVKKTEYENCHITSMSDTSGTPNQSTIDVSFTYDYKTKS